MYFYTLSTGQYSDYHATIIMHEMKFTRLEFIQMYNEAVKVDTKHSDAIAEVMCEKFGFTEVKEEIEINSGYGGFKPIINPDDIEGDHTFIDSDNQQK